MKTAVYIDDTGTPAFKSKSKYDPGDWKTWVALILHPAERKILEGLLSEMCSGLNASIGIKEFHFVEIFSGKGIYRKMDFTGKMKIFYAFADIYKQYKFPVVVQSLTSDDVIRNQMLFLRKLKVDGFNFSINSDFALYFLLHKVKMYLLENNYELTADIIIDSGRQKHNTRQKVELLNKITDNSEIQYYNSHEDPLLQFIDFIAFTLNRVRWILMNEKRSDFDTEVLRLAAYADFNAVNLNKQAIVPAEFSAEDYDKVLRKAYDKNNNLPDAKVEEIKNRK